MTDPKPPSDRDEQQEQEKWYERTRYQILLFAGGIALFVLIGGWILDWYIAPKTSGQKKDLVQALGLITAGVAGAVGIYFTWRGQRQARQAQEENQRSTQEQLSLTRQSQEQNQQATQAQLENAQEELRLARQGQITERFTRAIDQLGTTDDEGNKLFEIRLGGIYALERIATESEEDYWPIMEVLTAYVRQHVPLKTEDAMTEEGSKERIRALDPDIQAIMTVLRRRSSYYGQSEPERLNLRATNLGQAILDGVDFTGAILHGVNLYSARLAQANLAGAFLGEAHLTAANLDRANLSGADLSRAILWGAILWSANLQRANLQRANLQATSLGGANLQRANLAGANLEGARDLTQEQLEQTIGDEHTELPEGHVRPEAWSKSIAEQNERLEEQLEEEHKNE